MNRHSISQRFLHLTSFAVLLLGLSVAAQTAIAQSPDRIEVRLLAPEADDLVPSALSEPVPFAGLAPKAAREPVTFSWPIAADAGVDLATRPVASESRGYWLEVRGAELVRGVVVPTTARGAIVRINPRPSVASLATRRGEVRPEPIDPLTVELAVRGEQRSGGDAIETLATAEQMAEAGVPFAPGTIAFRVGRDLPAGDLTVRAAAEPDATYVVHVFEPGSEIVARMAADRPNALDGQVIEVTFEVKIPSARGVAEVDAFDAYAISPAGRAWPLDMQRVSDTGFAATLPIDAHEAPAPGLWTVEAVWVGKVGGRDVRRGVRTAFAGALPTARMTGPVAIRVEKTAKNRAVAGLSASVVVETAAQGRYEIRGVLFGSDQDGQLRPMGVAHSAAWLGVGTGALSLDFDARIFAESKLAAPFEVRDLRLIDQPRMGLVHRQARGFVVPR